MVTIEEKIKGIKQIIESAKTINATTVIDCAEARLKELEKQ